MCHNLSNVSSPIGQCFTKNFVKLEQLVFNDLNFDLLGSGGAVAKSRVSNRSDSKKSDSGRVGREFQKVGFGYPKSRVFCRVLCTFYSKFYFIFLKVGFG